MLLQNDFVKLALIIVGAIVLFTVLNKYQIISNEGYDAVVTAPSTLPVAGMTAAANVAPMVTNTQIMPASAPPLAPVQAAPVPVIAPANPALVPQPVDDGVNGVVGSTWQQAPVDCYPKDTLTATDLLPTDKFSKWNAVNPTGAGDLADKNFLSAGYLTGVDTVGNSLKNQSYDLRGDAAPNPQIQIGPWQQSSFTPDLMRKKFEIGGNC